jgi:FMN-dependent NADH-azoreductase
MTNVLVLKSSAAGPNSVSSQLVDGFIQAWQVKSPALHVTTRDLGNDSLPHLTPAGLAGLFGNRDTPQSSATADISDAAVRELLAADVLVIGSPMYNLGMTSTLKAWFDHVVRAKVTFEYTAEGPRGLLHGKRAIVVESRGGSYSDGPAKAIDNQEPHLRNLLGLIGIKDTTFVRAEKLAISPESKTAAMDVARAELHALIEHDFAKAA